MKAAVFCEVGKVAIEERPRPQIARDQVLVKVERAGICGSDLHGYLHGVIIPKGTVMGHEFSGVIAEAGDEVNDFEPGQRVAVKPFSHCGECAPCMRGENNICASAIVNSVGLTPIHDGAFAEFVRVPVPGKMLFELPPELSFDDGALVEPLATSLHGVRLSRFKVGDYALVVGAGPIGLGVIQFLRIGGAGKIVALELSEHRASIASRLGADAVLNPETEGRALSEKISELTGGMGVDVVYECAGVPAAVRLSMRLARSGGQVMLLGITEKETSLNPLAIALSELDIRGCYAYTYENFQQVVELMSQKKIDTGPFVSGVISLDDIDEKGFKRLCSSAELVKLLVDPGS